MTPASMPPITCQDADGPPAQSTSLLQERQHGTLTQVCRLHYNIPPPLSHFLPEWERLPGVSSWVLRTIRFGYTLQFCRNPPCFNGVFPTVVDSATQASVLQQEISSLLLKGAIEEITPGETERGFYSRYFLVPRKGGGLRPILDLRRLNFALYKGKFKMLTLKAIISQIRPGDWFVTIDLKDAYFHIQVVQRHRQFLRFAVGGRAFQYRVLPFGLSLAPRTFTKCMDAALAPLRLQGIRVLNYLDDWLILAQSRNLVAHHRDIVLSHIQSLGLRLNSEKSVLAPAQSTVFLGVHMDSVLMQARLAPARISSLMTCLARFLLGHHVSVGTCRRMLGLMAAASSVLPLGLLHMRPFMWWVKLSGVRPSGSTLRLLKVSRSCFRALSVWRDPLFLRKGISMGAVSRRQMITTDASLTGWGAVFEGRPACGVFGEAEVDLFASQESSQCPLWFSLSPPAPLGIDAFAHPWPTQKLYAFPPIKLIQAVLARVRESGVRLLLVAPFWPSQPWFSELIPLLESSPWRIPVREDLLSQLQGRIWHPRPDMWKLFVWPIRGRRH
ncbi:uncharacterized protein LOC143712393 [Siphateles boraxobius]|uniref:uncharacterized protein LOC143712393 n=1 Tax=Siphateles boraxobius TaxID=180520 RepID=UPI00406498CF